MISGGGNVLPIKYYASLMVKSIGIQVQTTSYRLRCVQHLQ